jgi:hypothetical protein
LARRVREYLLGVGLLSFLLGDLLLVLFERDEDCGHDAYCDKPASHQPIANDVAEMIDQHHGNGGNGKARGYHEWDSD